MTKTKWLILIPIVAVLWGLSAWLICWSVSYHNEHYGEVISRTYEGRVYFDQAGYSELKQYLADHQEIIIDKMEVLSSTDPLIDFKFTVKDDVLLDYGENTETKYFDTKLGLFLAFVSLFGIVIFPIATVVHLSLKNKY